MNADERRFDGCRWLSEVETPKLLQKVFCLLLLVLAGNSYGYIIKDTVGNEFEFATTDLKIVALAPHIVENLYFAGAFAKLVATVEHSDYPKPATNLPIIGNYSYINNELILKLNPDLVIAWADGGQQKTIEYLKQLNIQVYISNPKTLEQVMAEVSNFSNFSDDKKIAKQNLTKTGNTIKQLRELQQTLPKQRALYTIWKQPLQTLNNQSFSGKLLQYCNLTNIFGDLKALAPLISKEAILFAQPQVIIDSSSDANLIKYWQPLFKDLPAVKNKAIYQIDDSANRPTPRAAAAILELCLQIKQRG